MPVVRPYAYMKLSIQEKAAYNLAENPDCIRFDVSSNTARVLSPVSGATYTIDEYGRCDCESSRACWHIEALKIKLAERASHAALPSNFASVPAPVVPQACPRALWCPECAGDTVNDRQYIGGRSYVSFRVCEDCGHSFEPKTGVRTTQR